MTNGSSQGLFVIVAVVIFGIFVAISYTLFKSNLQPSLANIFTDYVEKSENILKRNLIATVEERYFNQDVPNIIYKKNSGFSYTIDSMKTKPTNNMSFFGIGFGKNTDFKEDTVYRFSFDVTLREGSLGNIGGHFPKDSLIKHIKINQKIVGENETGSFWRTGLNHTFLKNEVVRFEILFDSKDFKAQDGNYDNGIFWIQPNRGMIAGLITDNNYVLDIENISIFEERGVN